MGYLDPDVKKYLEGISREEMIDRLSDQVDSWDMDTLVGWAKDSLREQYSDEGDEELAESYYINFDHEIDNEIADLVAEQEVKAQSQPQPQAECKCTNLFLGGHSEPDCPYLNKKR